MQNQTLRSNADWEKSLVDAEKRYNVQIRKKHPEKPSEFPCICKSFPTLDNSGYYIKQVFFYEEDCRILFSEIVHSKIPWAEIKVNPNKDSSEGFNAFNFSE